MLLFYCFLFCLFGVLNVCHLIVLRFPDRSILGVLTLIVILDLSSDLHCRYYYHSSPLLSSPQLPMDTYIHTYIHAIPCHVVSTRVAPRDFSTCTSPRHVQVQSLQSSAPWLPSPTTFLSHETSWRGFQMYCPTAHFACNITCVRAPWPPLSSHLTSPHSRFLCSATLLDFRETQLTVLVTPFQQNCLSRKT